VRSVVLGEGLRAGIGLGVIVVMLTILGLTPPFAWIPEVLLVGSALLIPIGAYGLAGYRAGRRARSLVAPALVGALAGLISGGIGGLSYVAFGKGALNLGVGLGLGTFGGAVIGAAGGLPGGVRRPPRSRRGSAGTRR
jgi:hypothetical protein